VTSEPLTFY